MGKQNDKYGLTIYINSFTTENAIKMLKIDINGTGRERFLPKVKSFKFCKGLRNK